MGNLFETISGDAYRSEEKFQEFVAILESPDYKEQLSKAYRLNYRNIFLDANSDEKFEYYSKLDKGFYDKNLEQLTERQKEKVAIVNFEKSDAAQNSKTFPDLVARAKALMLRVYVTPADNLSKNNLFKKTP